MTFSFDGERHTEKSVWGLEMHICVFSGGVSRACVAARVHAYQCLLCGYTAKVPTVFVFLLQQPDMLIWRGSAGIIDTGAGCGHVKCKLNIMCLSVFVCRREWLSLREIFKCIFNCQTPPAHIECFVS